MHALLKTKIGPFLVISSVLAVWTFLAAQPVQAHTPDSPTCSGLPTAEDFFDGTNEEAVITRTALTPALATKQGTGSAAKGGNTRYRYAKIIVPQLAAGELRVFDTRAAPAASDAVLCHGTNTRAQSRTSHASSHNSAESARTTALSAQMTAAAAGSTDASNTITESQARQALRNAASALRNAASALRSAATALRNADLTTEANNATTAANTAYTPANTSTDPDTPASGDAVTASTIAADSTQTLDNIKTALRDAADDLGGTTSAASALRAAANALHDTESRVFQLRAEVMPGDQEYILVTTGQDTVDMPTPAVQFHGAIANADVRRQRSLNAGDQHTYEIAVTAPGLLTVETTGSTDTSGMLSADVSAEDDSSGSGDNFRIVAPVPGASDDSVTYTVTVDGQTPATTGAYTLDMAFKVAMQTGLTADTGFTVPTAPTWNGGDTGITADDTAVQIQPSADEDYFLLTIAADSSGFLTIEATDDDTSMTDAATTGTFYGPTGELATDTNSRADSSHFRIRAPVEEGVSYLVKVTGTAGVYRLTAMLDQAEGVDLIAIPSTQSGPASVDCSAGNNDTGEICLPESGMPLETERYAFNIMEPGALYLHTTGSIDTVGTLYGPGGGQIATDDNSGDGNNFRIAVNVNPGLHLLEVRGKTRTTRGVYSLVTNFVAGADPTIPTTPGTGDDLQAEINRLQGLLDECREGVETDARGSLDDPNSVEANTGYRSGVGLIRGWVCAANAVEVRIFDATDRLVATVSTPYGSVRTDTAGICGHSNTGFAAQYNYNHLAEGVYTAQAYADGQPVNADERTFTVVHLTEFSRTDTNRFLEDLPAGTCDVEDFPETGDAVRLRWEESLQNFVIEDAS